MWRETERGNEAVKGREEKGWWGEVTEEGCGEMIIKNQARGQVPPIKANLRLQGCRRGAFRSTPQGASPGPAPLSAAIPAPSSSISWGPALVSK